MISDWFVEGVAMYNLPEGPDSRHTKGRGNGYVVSLGGQRIYISVAGSQQGAVAYLLDGAPHNNWYDLIPVELERRIEKT